MKGERSGMATPRNPMPRAAIAEIDEALMAAAWWEHADIHSTLKCRCLPVRSNVNDRMREGAGSFGNFSKPNIAQRDSV